VEPIVRTLVVLVLVAAVPGCRRAQPPSGAMRAAKLQPWEPFDPAFKGCEGG
jgi:hypothetical protein